MLRRADQPDVCGDGRALRSGASNWQAAFETPGFNSLVLGVDGSFLHPNFAARHSPVSNLFEYEVAVLRPAMRAPADAEVYGLHRTPNGVLTTSLGFLNPQNAVAEPRPQRAVW